MKVIYKKQLDVVIKHIHENLTDDLSIDKLASVANLSKFHFHRLFSIQVGLPVGQYIQLQRLNVAAYKLAFRPQLSIIDIALSACYLNHESFSRAFKKIIDQTPRDFRNKPLWEPWINKQEIINKQKKINTSNTNQNTTQSNNGAFTIMTKSITPSISIINFPLTNVAVLEHKGNPNTVLNSVQKFIAWRKKNKLPPNKYRTFNIVYNDPNTVEPADYQIDICVEVPKAIAANDAGIINKTLSGGKYAVLRHIGSDLGLTNSFHYLYSEWLPDSGKKLRDDPCFLQRVTMFPDVPEHEMIIDIFLPLQ